MGHNAEEVGWSTAQVVAAGTCIDLSSWEVVAVVLEASEAVPTPVAILLVFQRQSPEAVKRDEGLEAEEVGLKMLLEGGVVVEAEASASDVVDSTAEVEDPVCRVAVDCPLSGY